MKKKRIYSGGRVFCLVAAALMSCAAVGMAASAAEQSLLSEELVQLEESYENMTFSQLVEERSNIWIGEVTKTGEETSELRLPWSRDEEEGYTESWLREEQRMAIQILDTLSGYSYEASPEEYEGAVFRKRYLSQDNDTVLEPAFMNKSSTVIGEKLLVFGAEQFWLSKEQYIVDSSGELTVCYKTSRYNSDGRVAIDDF